jgi:hypothetical protein
MPPTQFDDFPNLFYTPTSFSTPTTHSPLKKPGSRWAFPNPSFNPKDKPMPNQTIYTFLPPILNKPVHGLLETGHTIRTSRIVILEESRVAYTLLGSGNGWFITTSSGSRYTLILLPISAFKAWLADFLGVLPTEVIVS